MNRTLLPGARRLPCLLLLAGLGTCGPALATVFECRSAGGAISLQDQPCAVAQQLLRQVETKKSAPPEPAPAVLPAAAPAPMAASGGAPVVRIIRNAGGGTLPQPYSGGLSSPVKGFVVRAYTRRCTDALARTSMARLWSAAQMEEFCTCTGGSLYDSQANLAGLKDLLLNQGRGLEDAANQAARGCVTGPTVPQWQHANGG